jgi:hypothetical protein
MSIISDSLQTLRNNMNRTDFMTTEQKRATMGVVRTHANMVRLTQVSRTIKVKHKDGSEGEETRIMVPGVARPGKTAKDRYLKRKAA